MFNEKYKIMKSPGFVFLGLVVLLFSCTTDTADTKPNVVIIFLDDSGWSDFEPFGKEVLKTPHVSQLAAEGTAFHNFYVPQAVCSASRSALMSGCFPGRTKVFGAHGPNAWGLDTTYATMGEVFGKAGYATAAFGKWHCGDAPETRSFARGFEKTCGLMYSNDMWRHHPESPDYWGQWPLQFWENGEVTIADVDSADQKNLTKWYTERAIKFIETNRDRPFLLYVPHSMPHVPLFCSKEFEGKSGKGLYGDVMLEIDWSVGQINQALKDNGIENNTIVIFTSDNGPWISYGNHAGSTPFREAKGTSFDGGVRSACIMKLRGQIKEGEVSEATLGTVDLLPSLCDLAGIPLPENEIDGRNVWDLITGREGAENPHRYYAFSNGSNFEGIISGDGTWKLHLPHGYRTLESAGMDGQAGKYVQDRIDTALFHMKADPFETTNVIRENPEVARRLIGLAEAHKEQFYSE